MEEELEDTDCIVKDNTTDTPLDIVSSNTISSLCLHPNKNWVATGSISGEVSIWSYDIENGNHKVTDLHPHKKVCRAISFSSCGDLLFTASKDKAFKIRDLNTGTLKAKILNAHTSPIYCLALVDQFLAATGDEEGTVKLWDHRVCRAVMEIKEMQEYVSSLKMMDERKSLIATGGEGLLNVFSINARKLQGQSQPYEKEFLCSEIVKCDKKVAVGSLDGSISLFTKDEWREISDSFRGHSSSVDCMIKISENIVCTGSGNGKIRAVNILPNRFIGIVGHHSESLPIIGLALSHDEKYVASCSYDNLVKFWNIDFLKGKVVTTKKKVNKRLRNEYLSSAKRTNFFADLA